MRRQPRAFVPLLGIACLAGLSVDVACNAISGVEDFEFGVAAGSSHGGGGAGGTGASGGVGGTTTTTTTTSATAVTTTTTDTTTTTTSSGLCPNGPADCPDDVGDCFAPACINGVCGTTYEPPGTECTAVSDGYCDVEGTCLACGTQALAPGGTCPAQCTSCSGSVCEIDCSDKACDTTTIDCPADFACSIVCLTDGTCHQSQINCPNTHECTLTCSGSTACQYTVLNCKTGTCTVDCLATCSCCYLHVNCGVGECNQECDHPSSTGFVIDCGPSCDCNTDLTCDADG